MIVSICNEKGGSGKSTLSVNIAIELALTSKLPILIIDTDPQKSIISFLDIRNGEKLPKLFDIEYKYGEDLEKFLKKKHNDKIIIIDIGGRDSKEMRIAISHSDMLIIPTIASQIDVSVLEKMVEMASKASQINADLKTFIVINKATTNIFLQNETQSLKEYIKELENGNIKLAKTAIGDRKRYQKAWLQGKGVAEYNDNHKAQNEIATLCKELFKLTK